MFLSGCGTFISSDKWNHFAFSASTASICTASTSKPVESISFTLGIGLLKEIYDGWFGSGFETGDLAADLAGAALGGLTTAGICMEEFP
jgi:uncharacterized protein YfiM (DUF2279 family)